MNNRPEPGAHPVFEALQRRVTAGNNTQDLFIAKAKLYVSFLLNPGTVPDPAPDAPEPDDFNNPDNHPGRFLTLLCIMDVHFVAKVAACPCLWCLTLFACHLANGTCQYAYWHQLVLMQRMSWAWRACHMPGGVLQENVTVTCL